MQDPFRQHQHQSHRLPHPEHELPPFLQHSQQQWRPDPQTEAYNAGMLAALQGASRIQQQHFIPPGITHSAPQIQHQIPSPYQQQQSISPAIPSPSQMSSPSASGSTQGQSPENQGDDDTGSMMDDKRRRNTAASGTPSSSSSSSDASRICLRAIHQRVSESRRNNAHKI